MFILQENLIDLAQARNTSASPHNGALVSFEGIVRADEHNACPPKLNASAIQRRRVTALVYIADAPVCVEEGEKIIKEAIALFPLTDAVCIQRTGSVNVGETAVWIGVWAGHRDEAFKGCRYIIEEIKKRIIIWKKESFADGTSAWVRGCQHHANL